MANQPRDLVAFGDRYCFPGNVRYPEQTATLTATPGPPLPMRFGMVAIADPWFPQAAPIHAAGSVGKGDQSTILTTVSRIRADSGELESKAVAASIGPIDQVVTWQPLVQNEQHFRLDTDSALGAFYEITDAAVLQPLFENDLHMKGIYDRALTELIVPHGGRWTSGGRGLPLPGRFGSLPGVGRLRQGHDGRCRAH
jgi:hypothetical protein